MRRYFLVLAVTDGALLVATFVLGLFAASGHVLCALLTTAATSALHATVYAYLGTTGKRLKEVVRVHGLPEWVNDQAQKNARTAFPFVFWGTAAMFATASLGLGWPLWHLGTAALGLAFNFGAFAVEYVVIAGHARLLREVDARVDRLRSARNEGLTAARVPGSERERQVPGAVVGRATRFD